MPIETDSSLYLGDAEEKPTRPTTEGRRTHLLPLLRNTSYVMAATVASQVITAALFVVLARSAPISEFGFATAIYGICMIGSDVIDFGTSGRMVRDAAAGSISPRFIQVIWSTRLLVGVCAVPLWVASSIFLSLSPLQALAAGVLATTRAWAAGSYALLMKSERFGILSVTTTVERLGSLLAASTLVFAGQTAATALCAGMAFGCIVGMITATLQLQRQDRPLLNALPSWRYFKFGRSYAASGLVTDMALADTTIVGMIAGHTQAGLFVTGARLTGPFGLVSGALAQAVAPRAAQSYEDPRAVRLAVRWMITTATLVTSLAMAAVAASAPWVLELVFGSQYVDAATVVRLYCLASVIVCVTAPLSSYLQAVGRAKSVARTLAVGVAVHMLGVAFGSFVGGASTAALGYVLANVLIVAMLGRIYRRVPERETDNRVLDNRVLDER